MRRFILILLLLSSISLLFCQSNKSDNSKNVPKLNLHVPSPDWQDQVIYFLMIDRFNDGNSSNNDQGMGEYDPNDDRKFYGGDIEGVIQKIDYIKNLGATAIWVTPPVANQWWDSISNYGGYHGYWAENFKKIDAHFGSLKDYQLLSHYIHENGMYLIQDIVLNHTGNFFMYDGVYNPNDVTSNYKKITNSVPVNSPTQYPFNLNNPNNPEHRKANIYHWTPEISNYEDENQKFNYQMAGLDDINTNNIVVREVLRDSYGYWIHIVGVDGFRIDTIIYVELDYWADFMNSDSKTAPGINNVAAKTGRENFLTFGETFISSEPLSISGDIEVASYQGTKDNPALNSMLDYPLYYSIARVFAQGAPTKYLTFRLDSVVNGNIYKNPYILANFIDNHDVSRFISNSKPDALMQALTFLFTIPGIPVIYQGTEQLFSETRTPMFIDKTGKGNHFDENSNTYLFIKKLAQLRKDNKLLSRGDLKIIKDTDVGPGVMAYSRTYENNTAFVFFNTADHPILTGNINTGLPDGNILKFAAGIGLRDDLVVGNNGKLNFVMPARSVGIYFVSNEISPSEVDYFNCNLLSEIKNSVFKKDFVLKGKNDNNQPCQIIIDGNLNSSLEILPNRNGKWKTTIPISIFPFGESLHTIVIYSPDNNQVSDSYSFKTDVKLQGLVVEKTDPQGDDNGPTNQYTKPTNESYKGQMDITNIKAIAFGGNLQISITTSDFSDVWLPPNGFDHASFSIYLDFPEMSGKKILPKVNAIAPDGFEWNYLFYIQGWNQALYEATGSDKDNYGTIITPTPSISVDKESKKITIQFSSGIFGNITNLEGVKIYITTWDSTGGEDGYQVINKAGGDYIFGGASEANPPLILDDIEVITISNQK